MWLLPTDQAERRSWSSKGCQSGVWWVLTIYLKGRNPHCFSDSICPVFFFTPGQMTLENMFHWSVELAFLPETPRQYFFCEIRWISRLFSPSPVYTHTHTHTLSLSLEFFDRPQAPSSKVTTDFARISEKFDCMGNSMGEEEGIFLMKEAEQWTFEGKIVHFWRILVTWNRSFFVVVKWWELETGHGHQASGKLWFPIYLETNFPCIFPCAQEVRNSFFGGRKSSHNHGAKLLGAKMGARRMGEADGIQTSE